MIEENEHADRRKSEDNGLIMFTLHAFMQIRKNVQWKYLYFCNLSNIWKKQFTMFSICNAASWNKKSPTFPPMQSKLLARKIGRRRRESNPPAGSDENSGIYMQVGRGILGWRKTAGCQGHKKSSLQIWLRMVQWMTRTGMWIDGWMSDRRRMNRRTWLAHNVFFFFLFADTQICNSA